MDNYSTFDELDLYLKKQGHSQAEIRKIIGKLEEYDKSTIHDSIFDSLENGTFSLESIIQEAIAESDESDEQAAEKKVEVAMRPPELLN